MEITKPDCVLKCRDQEGNDSCVCMTDKVKEDKRYSCDGCSFYKNVEAAARSKKAWVDRMNSLPEDYQQELADKYHFGIKCWR